MSATRRRYDIPTSGPEIATIDRHRRGRNGKARRTATAAAGGIKPRNRCRRRSIGDLHRARIERAAQQITRIVVQHMQQSSHALKRFGWHPEAARARQDATVVDLDAAVGGRHRHRPGTGGGADREHRIGVRVAGMPCPTLPARPLRLLRNRWYAELHEYPPGCRADACHRGRSPPKPSRPANPSAAGQRRALCGARPASTQPRDQASVGPMLTVPSPDRLHQPGIPASRAMASASASRLEGAHDADSASASASAAPAASPSLRLAVARPNQASRTSPAAVILANSDAARMSSWPRQTLASARDRVWSFGASRQARSSQRRAQARFPSAVSACARSNASRASMPLSGNSSG